MSTMKVAIVGCGKIADAHVEEIQKMPSRARLVAVCDQEQLIAEQLAVRYGISRYYDRLDDLLARERPDVLHITTPPWSHLPLAEQALAAGCHLYVEKPFTPDAVQTGALLAAAEAARRKVTVGWSPLFDPPALAMRRLVRGGALGDPVHVESFCGYSLTDPFGKALLDDPGHWVHGLPGKLFQNVIDHPLNRVAEFISDDRPAMQVCAYSLRPQRFGDARDEFHDELRVLLRGARTTAYLTFSASIRPAGQIVRIYGTRRTFQVDYVARTVTLEASPRFPSAVGRLGPAFERGAAYMREGMRNALRFARSDFHYFAGLNELIGRFYESVLRGGPVPIPYREIQRMSDWTDEIFRQVREAT